MAIDEITPSNKSLRLELTKVPLLLDKRIFLIRAFALDLILKKKYMKTALIIAGDEIVTARFGDTVHLMEELGAFDTGNEQNKYLDITEYKSTKNLRLKLEDETLFLSKTECRTIYKLFYMSLQGYSLSSILEFEYDFTPETLTRALNDHGYLEIER